jgi:hypothetical protein
MDMYYVMGSACVVCAVVVYGLVQLDAGKQNQAKRRAPKSSRPVPLEPVAEHSRTIRFGQR